MTAITTGSPTIGRKANGSRPRWRRTSSILFMANHGVIVTGRNVAEAYDRLYYLERACQVQLHALWTGHKLKYVSLPVVEKTRQQFARSKALGNKPAPCEIHFAALKRLLDRKEPDYAD